MAAPHVAGAVALLWSVVPDLRHRVSETEGVLTRSAHPRPSGDCRSSARARKNNIYGYGELKVGDAVEAADSLGLQLSTGRGVAQTHPDR